LENGMIKRLAPVAMMILTTACSGGGEEDEDELLGTWVARLEGQGVWAAVTVQAGEAAVFVCGAGAKLETHSRWMPGGVEGSGVDASGDGFTASWTLDDQPTLSITEPDGSLLEGFAVNQAQPEELAGVYVAFDAGCSDGVIVFSANEDGSQVDALGAWCDGIGNFSQVTPILPWTLETPLSATVSDPDLGDKEVVFEVAQPSSIQ
jgi:hypothetical protein